MLQRAGKRAIIADGAWYNALSGITSNYTIPLALALGAGAPQVGIISAAPKLASTLASPVAGRMVHHRPKRLACWSAAIERLSWLGVAVLPLLVLKDPLLLLTILLVVTSAAGAFLNMGWVTWMGDLIPVSIRGRFFGRRNAIASATALVSAVVGGGLLAIIGGALGFTTIFVLAAICGAISYLYIIRTPEPAVRQRVRTDGKGGGFFWRFTAHMTALLFGIYIASPFFAVYMLKNMHIGYVWFMLVTAAEMAIAILFQPYWGRLADRFGNRAVMAICNVLVVFYPLFWLFISEPWHILFAAAFSGFAWSGFDLAAFNYLLEASPARCLPDYIGRYKFVTGLALFAGPLLGGIAAEYFAGAGLLWWSGLQLLFLLSFVLRGVATAVFVPMLPELRVKQSPALERTFWRAVAIWPLRAVAHDLSIAQHALLGVEQRLVRDLDHLRHR